MIDRVLEVLKEYNYNDFSECKRQQIIDIIRTEPETIIESLLEIIDRLS